MTTPQRWIYGAGDLGVALLYVAINTYFFYFLVNVAGFAPLTAGGVFLVGRLVDAFTDPLIGRRSDALRDSLGRLPFLRRAILPTALTFVLLFAAPLSPVAPVLCAVAAAVAFSIAHTCVMMPYLAILPELVPDYDARTSVIGVKSVFTMLATLLAFALPPAVVLALSGAGVSDLAESAPSAWVSTAAVLAAVAAVPLLLLSYRLSEPRTRSLERAPAPASSALTAELRSAFGTRGMREALWMFLTVTVGLMVTNSLLAFFMESVLGLPGDALPLVLGGLVLVSIVTFPVWVAVAKRIGKRGGLIAALAVVAASLLLLVAVVPPGRIGAALIAVVALNGFGVGGVTLFPWAILPDVVEIDELASGRRREGLLYAVYTFGQKVATSVGVFANAIVIGLFGYVQGSAQQSPDTIEALRVMMGPVSAGVFVLAALLVWRYPITREVHEAARLQLSQNEKGPGLEAEAL